MRRMLIGSAVGVALAVAVVACGGDTRLTLDEYVAEQQTMTDELEDMGLELAIALLGVVDLNAGTIIDPSGLQTVLQEATDELGGYLDRLTALAPPEAIEAAHDGFVAAANDRLEQWRDVSATATELESVDALVLATDKSPAFFEACLALEAAVADEDLVLDLDCD